MEEEQSQGGDFPPKKSQLETAPQQPQTQTPTATDFPQKKLARQLDFTGYSDGSSPASSVAALPEHPNQTQSSSEVLKTSQPQLQPQQQPPTQSHTPEPSQPPKPQSQPQPLLMLMPVQQPPVPPPVLPAMRPL